MYYGNRYRYVCTYCAVHTYLYIHTAVHTSRVWPTLIDVVIRCSCEEEKTLYKNDDEANYTLCLTKPTCICLSILKCVHALDGLHAMHGTHCIRTAQTSRLQTDQSFCGGADYTYVSTTYSWVRGACYLQVLNPPVALYKAYKI